jgi:hypothetical protein
MEVSRLYQIAHFFNIPDANNWLKMQVNILVIEHKVAFPDEDHIVVTILYKR